MSDAAATPTVVDPAAPPWHEPFDAAGRAALLAELATGLPGERRPQRLLDLLDRYARGVPLVRVARCPFSGAEAVRSIDTFGLDGPWWSWEAPVRPPELTPSTWWAWTGALRLGGPPEPSPQLVRPGPDVPAVVPRLLEREGVVAVISTVQVGAHTAWPVSYFAEVPPGPPGWNGWAESKYWFLGPDGRRAWNHEVEDGDHHDVDLAPWIERGKLRWIAPGDDRLRLRSEVDGCPYVGVAGRGRLQSIADGSAW